MNPGVKRMDVEAAIKDLKNRTLASISTSLGCLIYLASTRDYNTAKYYHEGLASQFTPETAASALLDCHQEAFKDLAYFPLQVLVQEVDAYVISTGEPSADVLAAWASLEPFRVAIPSECDALAAELLGSNLRIAVAILQARQEPERGSQQSA